MSNLAIIPQEDGFRTSLAQEYTGWLGTMFLQAAPNFTMPVWETCYAAIQANWASPFLVEFDSIDIGNNTINITNVTLFKGAGIANPTGVTYPTNTEVIISDNYQFWSDIKDAINSKLDSEWTNTTTTWDLQVQGSSFRIRLDSGDMKFTDDNNVEISLSTIAAASGADRKVAISPDDTTPGELDAKILAWDGLAKAIWSPAWNETTNLSIDLITTNGLKFTTNQLDVEPATNTQVGTQRISTDAEAITWALEDVSINPKQLSDATFNLYSFSTNWVNINDWLTRFISITGQSTPNATESAVQVIIWRTWTLRNLSIKPILNTNPWATPINISKNGVWTWLTVNTIGSSTTLVQDLVNTVPVVAWDLLTIKATTPWGSWNIAFTGSLEVV